MPNTTTESVTAELRALIARKMLNTSIVADKLGVSTMWVSRRMRDLVPLTVDEFVNICQVIEADPVDVLAAALSEPAGAVADS